MPLPPPIMNCALVIVIRIEPVAALAAAGAKASTPASASAAAPHLMTSPRSTLPSLPRLDEFGAQVLEFGLGYRPRLPQLIKLGDFVRHAEANHAAQFFPRLLGLLGIALGHAASLSDQIGEDAEIREQHQPDHPKGLAPTGNIVSPEQVTVDDNQQPEPDDKRKNGKDVHQEI